MNELYPQGAKLLKNAEEKIIRNTKISERNKDFILKFKRHCESQALTDLRMVFHLTKLRFIAEGTKDFDKWGREDVESVLVLINKRSGTPQTKNGFISCLRCFFRYVLELDSSDPLPKWLKWIRKEACPTTLKKEDLWTGEELSRFFNCTSDPMWKAMFYLMWEGALRPGEVRSIRIKDCTVEGTKIKIYVRGKMAKTQGDRPIFIIKSHSVLKHWLDMHKFRNNPEAYLFCDTKGNPIIYNTFLVKFKRTAKESNITKKAFPYLLRHTTATEVYKNQNPIVARKILGHGPNSRMENVYCHLNEDDIEEAVTGTNGETRISKREITVCSRCGKANKSGSESCFSCGFVLKEIIDEETQKYALRLLKALRILETKYPEIKGVFEEIAKKEGMLYDV